MFATMEMRSMRIYSCIRITPFPGDGNGFIIAQIFTKSYCFFIFHSWLDKAPDKEYNKDVKKQ